MVTSYVPGPGTYQYNDPQGIKYSFGRKTQIKDKEIKPGPGAYENQFKEFAPSYSMSGKKSERNDKMANPGPGTYNYKSTVLGVPSSKIGSQKRGDWPNLQTPGPGSYYNDHSPSEGPKYGFGSQMQRPNTANPAGGSQSMRGSMVAPGPGTYNQSSIFDSKKGPAMSSRHADVSRKQLMTNPGPGAYDPEKVYGKNSIKIGTSERGYIKQSGTPGPGTYNSNFATKPRTANYGMGSEQRMRPMSAKNSGPGPGNYNYQSKVVEGPKWGFGSRQEENFTSSRKGGTGGNKPGPGQYLPNYSQITDKQPTFKFGTSSRATQLKKQNPGPGQYDIRKGIGGPKYGFGSSIRANKLNQTVPGPGSYTLPGTVGAVPKYLLPNGPRHV